MDFDEHGYICPYNEACRCQIADCEYCGWNPVVAERRLEQFLEKHGIEKEEILQRPIDAVQLVIALGKVVGPLVQRNSTPQKIYAAVLKCIASAPNFKPEIITCEKCCFAEFFAESGRWKCRSRHGMYKTVDPDFYCSRGKRREDDGDS